MGKVIDLISSNSGAGVYLPSIWLSNTNVNWLINLVHLPNPLLPTRLSLIILWAELSGSDPIPIVNPLLYTVCIVGGKLDAHSYLGLLKINKETDCFGVRLLSLCLLVYNMMTNWKYFGRINDEISYKLKFFGKINDECSWTWIVARHSHLFYLTWWATNIKLRVVL